MAFIERIKLVNAEGVVIDALASVFYRILDLIKRRMVGVDLIEALLDLGATVMVMIEFNELGLQRKIMEKELLVYGSIMMRPCFLERSCVEALRYALKLDRVLC